MRHVHLHNIIHRDLKPGNILLDENWRAWIGDFGLSRSRSAKGLPTPEDGTYGYAAAEQMTAGVPYTGKVDVHAFGRVLCDILQDVPAFPGVLSHKWPRIPSAFGPLMQDLTPRCLSVSLAKRHSKIL
jgi:serine/threonine protein kinase